jgi:hypothetical protein
MVSWPVNTAASVLAVTSPAGSPPAWAWWTLALVTVLAGLTWFGRGRAPFRAAVTIALLDVVLLVVA